MKKAELRNRLMAGEKLVDILPLIAGQDCEIYKAPRFRADDEIIYIPDVSLNELPVDKDLSCDIEGIYDILGCCYTGEDFMNEADGERHIAEELFAFVDWQHPSSAMDEEWVDREEGWFGWEEENE